MSQISNRLSTQIFDVSIRTVSTHTLGGGAVWGNWGLFGKVSVTKYGEPEVGYGKLVRSAEISGKLALNALPFTNCAGEI